MITDEQVEVALKLLDESPQRFGQLWGAVKAGEHLVKQYFSRAFMATKTGSVEYRKAEATTDPEYIRIQHDYENAEAEYKTLWAQISAAKILLEVYRTQQASNRARML